MGSTGVSDSSVGKGRFSFSIARCIYYSGSDLQAMSESGSESQDNRDKNICRTPCVNTQVRKLYCNTCASRGGIPKNKCELGS